MSSTYSQPISREHVAVRQKRAQRILLVDYPSLFRDGLASLLRSQPGFEVVGEASSVREAGVLSRALWPDLVLVEWDLPDGTGIDALRAVLSERPQTQVIFLTARVEDDCLFAAVRAGASGYILKSVAAARLLAMLKGIEDGEPAFSAGMFNRILSEFVHKRHDLEPHGRNGTTPDLTSRELHVLHELAQGASNCEIATSLSITENTVRNHVASILRKLDVRNRREAARYARDHHI